MKTGVYHVSADQQGISSRIEIALQDIPFICVHAHLHPKQLTARGLHHVLPYHVPLSELYSAGMPRGDRLSWCTSKEAARSRIEDALPHLKHVKNASLKWAIKSALDALPGWASPITAGYGLTKVVKGHCSFDDWLAIAREVRNEAPKHQFGP
ncbi:MAG: hypothetical protein JW839_07345 [Candidatus Lokiarchaeota archaeon]|nr:hypothetical protein [Candidatus Lokiarchaeota archaeon]